MADPITNAKLEQKRIEEEIEVLRMRLDKVAAFIEMYNVFAGNDVAKPLPVIPLPTAPVALGPPPLPPIGKPAEAPKKLTVADRVAAILSDGQPRKPLVLLKMLEADGSFIGTGDESRRITNLSSQLSRDKQRFKSSRLIGWSLIDQPKPQIENPSSVGANDGFDD